MSAEQLALLRNEVQRVLNLPNFTYYYGTQYRDHLRSILEETRAAVDPPTVLALCDALEEAHTLIESLRPSHYYCDDCWYSCPKAPDGCCDDRRGPECDCGADPTNARIDAFLASYKETPEPAPVPLSANQEEETP